jgi:4-amino-4-deoxy-L-arabinose transferase-like glycosyltransferase
MWWIATVYRLVGVEASDAIARLAAVLAALPILAITVTIAYRLYGGGTALVAGLILATMHEFFAYAINPEADIFLCLLVTATIATFVHLEFGCSGQRQEGGSHWRLWNGRPVKVALLFLLLGSTNWAKGLIFGTVMAGTPIAVFLLSDMIQRRSWQPLRPYLWLWGFVAMLAAALAWPAMVINRYPEIVQLWQEHYLGRLHRGYLREPWWYYAVQTPYVLLPWTIAAFAGLLVTARAAACRAGRERFLWCWALAAPVILSLADGKHHHYLLHCLGAWAILAAVGLVPLWQWCRARLMSARWLPGTAAVAMVAVSLMAASIWHDRIPGSGLAGAGAAALLGLATFLLLTACRLSEPRRAFALVLLPVVLAYAVWIPYQAAFLDDYRDDLVFLQQAEQLIPNDAAVFVQYDWTAPLETFWVLYHLQRPGILIRDPWQAAEKTGGTAHPSRPAYILARRLDQPLYAQTAIVETLLESVRTRGEKDPSQRRVLYRLHFYSPLPPAPQDYLRLVRRTLW